MFGNGNNRLHTEPLAGTAHLPLGLDQAIAQELFRRLGQGADVGVVVVAFFRQLLQVRVRLRQVRGDFITPTDEVQ